MEDHKHTKIIEALLQAQKKLSKATLKKDASNPFFKGKYVTLNQLLDVVLPILNDCGILLLQKVTIHDGQPALTTMLSVSDGDFVADTMYLMLKTEDPQAQGSAITYARRYSLMSMLGLVGEDDDDGNAATQSAQQQATGGARAGDSSKPVTYATEAQVKLMLQTVARKGIVNRLDAEKVLCRMAEVVDIHEIPKSQASVLIDWLFKATGDELKDKYLAEEVVTELEPEETN